MAVRRARNVFRVHLVGFAITDLHLVHCSAETHTNAVALPEVDSRHAAAVTINW